MGLSTDLLITAWFFSRLLCASQLSTLWSGAPEITWMKRTLRSTRRRARSSAVPYSSVSLVPMPYSSRVAAVSLPRSTASGADVSIL